MIRVAKDQDTVQIRDMWAYCFNDTPEFIDFFFQTCYKPENTVVALEGDRVCSCLQLLPYRIKLRGRPVEVCYIVGVATWPEYRGMGYASRLLQYADELLRERGIHVSILLPFQYEFYRKYGWEICYDLLTYRELEPFKSRNLLSGTFIKIDPKRDFEELAKCYLQFMGRFHGYVIRNQENWHKMIRDLELDHGTSYLYRQDGTATGYIFYIIEENLLTIKELVYLNPSAKEALLQLALSHTGQVNRILWKAPASDKTYLNMKDSRGKLEKEAFVMGRIHDITGALSDIPFHGAPFILKVDDPVYSSSNGCFLIRNENGVSMVSKTDKEPDADIDIRTLTQLLWGYLSVPQALAEGWLNLAQGGKFVEVSTMLSLQAMFPPMDNFILEEY
jgi:predicted acetyltransferase